MTNASPVRISDSYEDLYERGMFYFEQDYGDEALLIFERLYKRLSKLSEKSFRRRPDLKELQLLVTEALATVLGQKKEFDRALVLFDELMHKTPPEKHLKQWLEPRIYFLIEKGEIERALDELHALAVMRPNELWIWSLLGHILFRQANYEEAEANLKRALEREGESAEYVLAQSILFSTYREMNRFDEAEELIQAMWRKTGNPDAQQPLALYLMYLYAENLEKAEYWLKKEKHPLRSNFYLGLVAQKRGDKARAIKYWKQAVAMSPLTFDEGHDSWAESALRLEENQEDIIRMLEEAMTERAITIRAAMMLAIAYIRADDLDKAHTIFEGILKDLDAGFLLSTNRLVKEDWQTFTELIPDAEIQEAFKQYFEEE